VMNLFNPDNVLNATTAALFSWFVFLW
jgi:hypothetical protein